MLTLACLLTGGPLRAQILRPAFLDPTPADTTVDCYGDLPDTVTLRAVVLLQGGLIDTVDVVPDTETPTAGVQCNGGTLRRTWTATDARGSTVLTQEITFGAATPFNLVITNLLPDTTLLSCGDTVPQDQFTVTACVGSPTVTLTQNSDQGSGGCAAYNYRVTQVIQATDACGNIITLTRAFRFVDDEAPDFDRPADVSLDCDAGDFSPVRTGTPVNLSDNCSDVIDLAVSFTDQIISSATCGNRYVIRRSWRVEDECGNSRVRQQNISVDDRTAPTFDPPPATDTLTCSDLDNPALTGRPTNLRDNCDATPTVTFTDTRQTTGGCTGTYQLGRTWTVSDDCDNATTFTQVFTVIDTTAPVFLQLPTNLIVNCGDFDPRPVEDRFTEWVTTFGDAGFTDECTARDDLTVILVVAGSGAAPTLPAPTCGDALLRQLDLILTVADPCGNAVSAPLRFEQRDTAGVALANCGSDLTVMTDPDECTATITLTAPTVLDNCFPDLVGGSDLTWSVDGAPATPVTPGQTIPNTLPVGTHPIVFNYADCAGNTATCSYAVTVEDVQPPSTVNCPADSTIVLPSDACSVAYVPPTITVIDNCGPVTITTTNFQTLGVGDHPQTYLLEDVAGNRDSCRFTVSVRDTIAPRLVCRARAIVVDPAGIQPTTLDPNDFLESVTEACTFSPVTVSPAAVSCDRAGTTLSLRLEATDANGNTGACTLTAAVTLAPPEPTASMMTCDGDTLRLFANPPTPTLNGASPYTFRWFGPDGNLVSIQENPVLLGVSADDQGLYRVTIQGASGCVAENVVSVAITAAPERPVVNAPTSVCNDATEVTLRTDATFSGSVRYDWYAGDVGSGTLVASTIQPSTLVFLPAANQTERFYLIISRNGCDSPPSAAVTVTRVPPPTASITADSLRVCAGEDLVLSADATPNAVYEWSGPNGFVASGREVVLPDAIPAQSGTYFLQTVRGEGCLSAPDSVVVIVQAAPPASGLTGDNLVCTGDTLRLTAGATGVESYEFIAPDGTVFPSVSPTLVLPVALTTYDGSWSVRTRNGDCVSAPGPGFTVRVATLPTATASTLTDPVCVGSDLELSAGTTGPGESYSWTGPDAFRSSLPNPTLANVTTAAAGTYLLTVSNAAGCGAVDSVAVNVLPGITIDSLVVSSEECLDGGETVELFAAITPADPGYQFSWSGPEGTSSARVFTIPSVSLASNGTYTLTVRNAAGCQSAPLSRNVEFDFAPGVPVRPFPLTGSGSRCLGDSLTLATNDFGADAAYRWQLPDGRDTITAANEIALALNSAATSGDYRVSVMRRGCTSVPSEARTVTVTMPPVLTATVEEPVCSGQPLQLRATEMVGIEYVWRGPAGFSSTVREPRVERATAASHAGRYAVIGTRNGCPGDSVFVDVRVRPTPAVPALDPIAAICLEGGDDLRIDLASTAVTGERYAFRTAGGSTLGDTTGGTFVRSDLGVFGGRGTYSIVATATADGCTSAPSVAREFTLSSGAGLVADAGADTTVCAGPVTLNARTPDRGRGRWTQVRGDVQGSIGSETSALTTVEGLTPEGGPYAFAWTLSEGACANFSADTVVINVTEGESARTGGDLVGCLRQEVRLNALPVVQPGSTGEWTQSLTQDLLGIVITDPEDPNTTITNLQANNRYAFTWTVTNRCGMNSETIIVSISDPNPYAGEDQALCTFAGTAELEADLPSLGSTGRWTSPQPVRFTDPDAAATQVSDLVPGTNVLVWEVDTGFCGNLSRDTVLIEYTEPPVAEDDDYVLDFQERLRFAPLDNDSFGGEAEIDFTDIPTEIRSLEDTGDGEFVMDPGPDLVGEVTATYTLTVPGCPVAEAAVTFRVGEGLECDVPNIFTPNNDGVNDFFVVPCLLDESRFPESEMTIYNQWGDEVFRSEGAYRNEWNGTFQGNALPVGTYFYVLKISPEAEALKGNVRIER